MRSFLLALLVGLISACGTGVPIQVRIDDFTTTLDLAKTTAFLEATLKAQGVLAPESAGLPELWPASLRNIEQTVDLSSSPQAINLNPNDPNQAKKYAQLKQYTAALQRIEINKLILRFEDNTANIDIPSLQLQAAAGLTANADDNKAWLTIGTVPGSTARVVSDQEFTFEPGGESFLDAQLSSELKQFSVRTRGALTFKTKDTPQRPTGHVTVRLILIATFFVSPEKL